MKAIIVILYKVKVFLMYTVALMASIERMLLKL